MTQPFVFFLGGQDLEMVTIRDLVETTLGPDAVRDRRLAWGARLSDYASDLKALPPDRVPVLVELGLDAPVPPGAVVIDHHAFQAGHGAPTSLEQVFRLLNLPRESWTRHHALVAANDRGHVRALRAIGASDEEIEAIRRADRRAQGITPEEEEQGEAAFHRREAALSGALTMVRLPHSRTAVVADRMSLCGPADAVSNLLIICPGEIDFFGHGAAVEALDTAFPGGWSGGDLPDAGFWGHAHPLPEADVLAVLAKASLRQPQAPVEDEVP